jgi:hypothetical protein
VDPAAGRIRGVARRAARPGLGLAIVVVLGADLFLATHWNHSTPVTLAQSVEHFRASQGSTVPDAATTTTVAPAATVPPSTVPPASGRAPTATTAPPRRGSAPNPSAALTSAAGAFTKPAEGVYAYATTGYEKVSFGGARHDYPSESFAAVRGRAGCQWEWEHRVVEEHVENATYCSMRNVLEFVSDTQTISFFGQTEKRTITCNPPEIEAQIGDAVGTSRHFVCTMDGGGGRIEENVTYAGREVLTIGGTPVETYHSVIEGTQTGEAQGTSRFDVWVHPLTGLPVKQVQHVQTRSHAFGTTIDYTEDASYTLERLTPAT